MPLKFFVPHQLDNEQIIILLRRHWFTLFERIIIWVLIALMPVIGAQFFSTILMNAWQSPIWRGILIVSSATFYLYLWIFALYAFVDYYLDVWIVTSQRIINTEQKGLFARTSSEQKLSRIQDVTSEVVGIFETILDYGTIYIQTAGEQERFIFKQVPHPGDVAKKILKIIEQNKKFLQVMEAKTGVSTPSSDKT